MDAESTLYHCEPSEPTTLSPHIEVEDPNQQEISNLRDFTSKQNDVIKKLIEKQDALENTIKGQNALLEEIIKRMKK